MSLAPRQLLERFQASALDRLRRIAAALWEIARGDDETDSRLGLEDIARELHTLKGESRMLGLRALSDVVHRVEDALALASSQLQQGPIFEGIARVLTLAAGVLKDAPLNDADHQLALGPTLQALRELAARPLPYADEQAPGPSASTIDPPSSRTQPVGDLTRPAPPTRRERWLQVEADRIDVLCGVVGELANSVRSLHVQTQRLTSDHGALRPAARSLLEDFERCQTLLDDVESATWAMRLVRLEGPLHELGSHARDLAHASGKLLRVQIRAGSSQIERTVLDTIWEPLVHLVRNAVDHGIEAPAQRGLKPREATLTLHAESAGPTVTLIISDDGRGVSLAEVRAAALRRGLVSQAAAEVLTREQAHELLFHHGFSTRSEISELSGRGVGLDIVRSRLNTCGGSVSLSSIEGSGTRVTMTVPVRLSKERALVIEHREILYALPSRAVLEMFSTTEQVIKQAAGGRALWSRYGVIPLRSLTQTLTGEAGIEYPQGLVLRAGDHIVAFEIPRIIGEYDLLRRPSDDLVAHVTRSAATAVLDDGRLVLWLAPADLVRTVSDMPRLAPVSAQLTPAKTGPQRQLAAPDSLASERQRTSRRKRILVVDDSAIMRTLIQRILAARNLEVTLAADGQAGLEEVEREVPDAVLIDSEMPVLDGLTLLERLRARWPSLPIAMFSGHSTPEHHERAIALGANAYLVKTDFDATYLVEAITRILGADA